MRPRALAAAVWMTAGDLRSLVNSSMAITESGFTKVVAAWISVVSGSISTQPVASTMQYSA